MKIIIIAVVNSYFFFPCFSLQLWQSWCIWLWTTTMSWSIPRKVNIPKQIPTRNKTHKMLSTDPMVDTWFLMSSPWPLATILASYLYFVLSFGPKYMANRKPFQLKEVLIAYNFLQVIFSVFLVYLVSAAQNYSDSCDRKPPLISSFVTSIL